MLGASEALVSGPDFGHEVTIPPAVAARFWERFVALFDPATLRYYIRMGLGDPDYVFQHGAVVVDDTHAGILWMVEGD